MTVWYLTSLTYPSTLANRLQVIKMTEAFSRHADTTLWVASMGGKKKEVLESYGVKEDLAIKELSTVSGILWPKSFFRALAFRRVVGEAPPETVFYIRDLLLAFFLSVLSPRFRGNFFFECHSLGKMPSMIYRRVFRNAGGIISTNKAKVEAIRHTYGINHERFLVAPNGFDAGTFHKLPSRTEARLELGLPQDKKIVLYAGSTQAWKGVEMMDILAKKLPDILFVILGASEEKRDRNLWRMAPVPNQRVPKYLRAADVLLAPYRSDSERAQKYFSPIKIMEYLASGTPIVATRLPAIEELPSSVAITFATNRDVDGFCNALRSVFNRYEEYRVRAEEAYRVVDTLDWGSRATRIMSFMQKTL